MSLKKGNYNEIPSNMQGKTPRKGSLSTPKRLDKCMKKELSQGGFG